MPVTIQNLIIKYYFINDSITKNIVSKDSDLATILHVGQLIDAKDRWGNWLPAKILRTGFFFDRAVAKDAIRQERRVRARLDANNISGDGQSESDSDSAHVDDSDEHTYFRVGRSRKSDNEKNEIEDRKYDRYNEINDSDDSEKESDVDVDSEDGLYWSYGYLIEFVGYSSIYQEWIEYNEICDCHTCEDINDNGCLIDSHKIAKYQSKQNYDIATTYGTPKYKNIVGLCTNYYLYLNPILQVLFHTPMLKERLFKANYDIVKKDKEKDSTSQTENESGSGSGSNVSDNDKDSGDKMLEDVASGIRRDYDGDTSEYVYLTDELLYLFNSMSNGEFQSIAVSNTLLNLSVLHLETYNQLGINQLLKWILRKLTKELSNSQIKRMFEIEYKSDENKMSSNNNSMVKHKRKQKTKHKKHKKRKTDIFLTVTKNKPIYFVVFMNIMINNNNAMNALNENNEQDDTMTAFDVFYVSYFDCVSDLIKQIASKYDIDSTTQVQDININNLISLFYVPNEKNAHRANHMYHKISKKAKKALKIEKTSTMESKINASPNKKRKKKKKRNKSQIETLKYTKLDEYDVKFTQIMANNTTGRADKVLELLCVIDESNMIQDSNECSNDKLNAILDLMWQEMNYDIDLNRQIIKTSLNNEKISNVKLDDYVKYKFDNFENVLNLPQVLAINCELDRNIELKNQKMQFYYPLGLDLRENHDCEYELYGVILDKQKLYTTMILENLDGNDLWFEITDSQVRKIGEYGDDIRQEIVNDFNACMLFYRQKSN